MLGILILGLVAHAMQPQVMPTAFRTLFTGKDRSSLFFGSMLDKRAQLISILFAIATLSMALFVCLTAQERIPCSLSSYGIIAALVVATLLIRTILQSLIAYTFFHSHALDTFVGHYYYLSICTAILLYAVVLVSLFLPGLTQHAILTLNGGIFGFYLLVLMVKCLLIFIRSFRGFIYTFVYILTLEVLPMLALLEAIKILINKQ